MSQPIALPAELQERRSLLVDGLSLYTIKSIEYLAREWGQSPGVIIESVIDGMINDYSRKIIVGDCNERPGTF